MTTYRFAVFVILARFSTITGEQSNVSSITPVNCKYSDDRKELDAVRQLLNQETLIRMSLENSKTIRSVLKEVEELKRNDGVPEVVTPHQTTDIGSKGNPTYVRWGKKSCTKESKLVYSGQAGGTFFTSKGGAANPLCLTFDVLWGNRTSASEYGQIHGAEYETNFWGSNFDDKDVPCAVCQLKTRKHILMIPGRNRCISGWTEEYHGYLASDSNNKERSRGFYSCVDEGAELLMGGAKNDNGYLFYSVHAKCGSLKCPPYIDNKPITCVVCSQ